MRRPYPLILDDTFACYDDRRLARTLDWLCENREQILLFTCQNREAEVMRREGIPFLFGGPVVTDSKKRCIPAERYPRDTPFLFGRGAFRSPRPCGIFSTMCWILASGLKMLLMDPS